MNGLMLDDFLKEISPDSPCGKNLEDDLAFTQLENDAKYIGDRQMGNVIVPGVVPDWKKVRESAIVLLNSSRDIQVAMHLTCALLHTDGFAGFVKGLSLIHGLLEKFWDVVYPQQDPDDDYPIKRINILSTLIDQKKVLDQVAKTKLIQSKAGNFSWRDIEIAQGILPAPSNSTDLPDIALIEAVFTDTAIDILRQQKAIIEQAIKHSQGIVNCVAEKSGSACAPDLSALINQLKSIDKFLGEKVQQRSAGDTVVDGSEWGNAAAAGEGLEKRNAVPGKIGAIHSRDEVIRALDAICKYFERYEPSSPIPFLLLRAKKLLSMNFMDIIKELAPDAIKQTENICGVQHKDSK